MCLPGSSSRWSRSAARHGSRGRVSRSPSGGRSPGRSPLSDTAWLAEFAKYKASPQYALLNQGMSLAEFQFIYWWEWAHRQIGRLIGLVFFLPFLWFWARGALSRRLALTLLAIGALGGLQGAVGWIMVASGLKPGMTAVAPIKLTLHLLLAGAILAALLWVATGLKGAARSLPEQR